MGVFGALADTFDPHKGLLGKILGTGSTNNNAQYNQISQARKSIRSLASQLDPVNQAQSLATIGLSRQLPLAQRQQLLAKTLGGLPQLVVQNAGDQALLRSQQQQQQYGMQYLQTHLQSLIDDGKAQAQFTRNLIPSVAPQLQPLMEMRAQQQESYGKQLADAYLQQFQAQPLIEQYQRQLAAQGKSLSSNSGGSSSATSSNSAYSTLPSGQ